MALDIQELFSGRVETVSESDPKLEIVYVVTGAADESEVIVYAGANIPTLYEDLTRVSFVVDERVNETTWKVRANYEKKQIDEEKPQRSFDTSGGTQHITQSLETVGKFGTIDNDPPDLGGAIGFDGESVQGVDVTAPVFNLQETHYFTKAQVTNTYMGTIFRATGKVNSEQFRGFNAGECLFLGASASQRLDEDWEITFKFAALPNRTAFTVGDIAVTEKLGWDYMWVRYGDEVDDASKSLIKKPVAVYVERVYETADFADLGLGEWEE